MRDEGLLAKLPLQERAGGEAAFNPQLLILEEG
jgi:hypothetical protein